MARKVISKDSRQSADEPPGGAQTPAARDLPEYSVNPEFTEGYGTRPDDASAVYSLSFSEVFSHETTLVEVRRKAIGLDPLLPIGSKAKNTGHIKSFGPYDRGDDVPPLGMTGLALSGGGIRSAAFCMGVTQAMDALVVDQPKSPASRSAAGKPISVFSHMDYLSTVSGGGYVGATLSVSLQDGDGEFPFPSRLTKDEPLVLQHIRDNSNYLFPKGGIWEKVSNLMSYTRGIAANIPLVVSAMALMLFLTVLSNPSLGQLNDPSLLWIELSNLGEDDSRIFGGLFRKNSGFFALSILLAIVIPIVLLIWALIRSEESRPGFETKTIGTIVAGILFFALFGVFAMEVQPKMISGLHANYCQNIGKRIDGKFPADYELRFNAADCTDLGFAADKNTAGRKGSGDSSVKNEEPEKDASLVQSIVNRIQEITVFIAGFTGLFAAIRGIFGSGEAHTTQQQGPIGVLGKYSRMTSQLIAGLLLPLALWIAYLYLAFWSIAGSTTMFIGETESTELPTAFIHAPGWIEPVMTAIHNVPFFGIPFFYVMIFIAFFIIALFISPNANSPHNLYRDSLARAFVVRSRKAGDAETLETGPEVRNMKLSSLCNNGPNGCKAPIHLINAALNIQGGSSVNGRGRDAGFFTFSGSYSGSYETGFIDTRDLETAEKGDFTLSSAVAISAAAASTAMGSQTMRPLALTFALLNVRLGYWLNNPRLVARHISMAGRQSLGASRLISRFKSRGIWLLFKELGSMNEKSDLVYLSDGGHIENLGLYGLLRRRCKVIFVVDAEADPDMTFASFMAVQRYARIDLGTRIELSTDLIKQANKRARTALNPDYLKRKKDSTDADGAGEKSGDTRPHCAIGTIHYPNDKNGKPVKGLLVYIKLSISGDENDYVGEYARKYRQFPHETTGDQFFSEEQFEAYRALGFHAAFKALKGEKPVQFGSETVCLKEEKSGEKKSRTSAGKQFALDLFLQTFPGIRERSHMDET